MNTLRTNSQHKFYMILKTQFAGEDYVKKLSSTLLGNAIKWVRYICMWKLQQVKNASVLGHGAFQFVKSLSVLSRVHNAEATSVRSKLLLLK